MSAPINNQVLAFNIAQVGQSNNAARGYTTIIKSGGIATAQALEEARNNPSGPITPRLIDRFIDVPPAPRRG